MAVNVSAPHKTGLIFIFSLSANILGRCFMANSSTVLIPSKKIEEARRLRDELDTLIETAEIMNNKSLMQSIKRSEKDIKEGRTTMVGSKKDLDDFFRR